MAGIAYPVRQSHFMLKIGLIRQDVKTQQGRNAQLYLIIE